jgi:hypothetical protein
VNVCLSLYFESRATPGNSASNNNNNINRIHQPENGGSADFWNVGLLRRDYTTLHPITLSSSWQFCSGLWRCVDSYVEENLNMDRVRFSEALLSTYKSVWCQHQHHHHHREKLNCPRISPTTCAAISLWSTSQGVRCVKLYAETGGSTYDSM